MFASIKTNGASHIVIHIPHEGSEKSLPALARMLEQNAVFLNSNYSDISIVKPSMSIILDNVFKNEHSETVIAINGSGEVLTEDFVNATPEVFVSNAKARKRNQDENSRIRTELSYVKQELERVKAQLQSLVDGEPA